MLVRELKSPAMSKVSSSAISDSRERERATLCHDYLLKPVHMVLEQQNSFEGGPMRAPCSRPGV